MTDHLTEQLREAFDGDSVPVKNIALRKATDEIEKLRADIKALNRQLDLLEEKSRHE